MIPREHGGHMREKYLVPLDGTPIAESGLAWAADAARRSGATLHLLAVKDLRADDAGLAKTLAYLDRHVDRLRAGGLRAEAQLKVGEPAERILQEARYSDIAVLTSGTTRWIISPVLDHVLKEMETPIVLVRGDRAEWKSASNLDRILMPVSESNYSSSAIPLVQRFASTFGSEVILLHNVTPVDVPGSPDDSPFGAVITKRIDVDLSQAEDYVERVGDEFRSQGLNVRTVVSTGEPAQQIVNVGREYGAGLIVMATRGRDRLESRIAGSVANVVLESTPIPCLLMRTTSAHSAHGTNQHATSAVHADVLADPAV